MLDGVEVGPDVAVAVGESHGVRVAGPDVACPAFSVTKMFVAAAVLRLVESGVLRLADDVREWLPQAPPEATVRELLCHTTGLADYVAAAPYLAAVAARPGQPWDLDRILDTAPAGDRGPLGGFRYCNAGYWLLGAVLEKATGRPLPEVLSATVFEPAGMASTSYPTAGERVTETGYDTRWAGPAGAVWSTPRDLVAFLSALFGGSLLSAGSLTAMTTAVSVAAGPPWREPGYGLGLMIDRGHGTVGHGGSGPGYGGAAFTTPASGRSVAVITREPSDTDPTELALRLLRPHEHDTP